jgi:hypothetical protein
MEENADTMDYKLSHETAGSPSDSSLITTTAPTYASPGIAVDWTRLQSRLQSCVIVPQGEVDDTRYEKLASWFGGLIRLCCTDNKVASVSASVSVSVSTSTSTSGSGSTSDSGSGSGSAHICALQCHEADKIIEALWTRCNIGDVFWRGLCHTDHHIVACIIRMIGTVCSTPTGFQHLQSHDPQSALISLIVSNAMLASPSATTSSASPSPVDIDEEALHTKCVAAIQALTTLASHAAGTQAVLGELDLGRALALWWRHSNMFIRRAASRLLCNLMTQTDSTASNHAHTAFRNVVEASTLNLSTMQAACDFCILSMDPNNQFLHGDGMFRPYIPPSLCSTHRTPAFAPRPIAAAEAVPVLLSALQKANLSAMALSWGSAFFHVFTRKVSTSFVAFCMASLNMDHSPCISSYVGICNAVATAADNKSIEPTALLPLLHEWLHKDVLSLTMPTLENEQHVRNTWDFCFKAFILAQDSQSVPWPTNCSLVCAGTASAKGATSFLHIATAWICTDSSEYSIARETTIRNRESSRLMNALFSILAPALQERNYPEKPHAECIPSASADWRDDFAFCMASVRYLTAMHPTSIDNFAKQYRDYFIDAIKQMVFRGGLASDSAPRVRVNWHDQFAARTVGLLQSWYTRSPHDSDTRHVIAHVLSSSLVPLAKQAIEPCPPVVYTSIVRLATHVAKCTILDAPMKWLFDIAFSAKENAPLDARLCALAFYESHPTLQTIFSPAELNQIATWCISRLQHNDSDIRTRLVRIISRILLDNCVCCPPLNEQDISALICGIQAISERDTDAECKCAALDFLANLFVACRSFVSEAVLPNVKMLSCALTPQLMLLSAAESDMSRIVRHHAALCIKRVHTDSNCALSNLEPSVLGRMTAIACNSEAELQQQHSVETIWGVEDAFPELGSFETTLDCV